jgi:hypothetical protein
MRNTKRLLRQIVACAQKTRTVGVTPSARILQRRRRLREKLRRYLRNRTLCSSHQPKSPGGKAVIVTSDASASRCNWSSGPTGRSFSYLQACSVIPSSFPRPDRVLVRRMLWLPFWIQRPSAQLCRIRAAMPTTISPPTWPQSALFPPSVPPEPVAFPSP